MKSNHSSNRDDGDKSPREYLLELLTSTGVSMRPERATQVPANSSIRCIAMRFRTEEELPRLYDKELLSVLINGDKEEVDKVVNLRAANAQNANGETVLMKVCRQTFQKENTDLGMLSLLLRKGANPMVCCDSGKNVLHDLFWSALPPPQRVLDAMEELVKMLTEYTGKRGILELMLSEDNHGFTPLDYIRPETQTNWKHIIETVVSWASSTQVTEVEKRLPDAVQEESVNVPENSSPSASPKEKKVESSFGSTLTSTHRDKLSVAPDVDLVTNLDKLCDRDSALFEYLTAGGYSTLLCLADDPDRNIITVSRAFVDLTGYSAEFALGRNCRFLQGPGTTTEQIRTISEALQNKRSVLVSITNYKADNTLFENNFLLTPLRDRNGSPIFFAGVQNCPPHIEHERMQQTLGDLKVLPDHQSHLDYILMELKLEDAALVSYLLVNKMSFLMSDMEDPDAKIVGCSPHFLDITGYTTDETLGRNCRFLQGPETSQLDINKIRDALRTQTQVYVSLINYRKDGRKFKNTFFLFPLIDVSGRNRYYLGIQNCPPEIITEREYLHNKTISNSDETAFHSVNVSEPANGQGDSKRAKTNS